MTKPAMTLFQFKKLVRGNQGFRLLTPGNPRTEKGKGQGYWTFILHLAPASLSVRLARAGYPVHLHRGCYVWLHRNWEHEL